MPRSQMPMRRSRPTMPRGFTLLELMLVMVSFGVLATVAVIAVTGQADNARVNATRRRSST